MDVVLQGGQLRIVLNSGKGALVASILRPYRAIKSSIVSDDAWSSSEYLE